jgi:hypothetical protein
LLPSLNLFLGILTFLMLLQMGLFSWFLSQTVLYFYCIWTSLFLYAQKLGGADVLCLWIYNCSIFLLDCSPFKYVVIIFISSHWFLLKIFFVWYENSFFCLLSISTCLANLFQPFTFSLCVFLWLWVVFLVHNIFFVWLFDAIRQPFIFDRRVKSIYI